MGEELISPAAEDRISIIVPFYNAESTLETCVQSVLLQTWDNWELLLVDDGSADGSPDLADTLADSDGRIRVRHTENHGVSRARNEGLKMAGGRYVTFLDADDRMAPDMLKKLHAVIIKSGAEIAGCSFHTFTDFKAQPPEETEEQEEGKEAVMDGTMFVRRRLLRGDTRIWSKLFLREKLGGGQFREDMTIGEDMLFLLSCMENCTKVAAIPDRLYYYYVNPKGAMEKPFTPDYMDQIRCWDEAVSRIRTNMPLLLKEEDTAARLAAVRCTTAMLVAGKIAVLPASERRKYADCTKIILERVKAARKVTGMTEELPAGYGLKSGLFRLSPSVYYDCYGPHRRGQQRRKAGRAGAAEKRKSGGQDARS
ncbi:MAG: glycosyltransferase [Lachnospiraceae bacterium]|jgi:glycosyltransferase involved in cell wall biosynthesis|nr:glycosyltransferase [Lachnospiraceae bacterium]